MIKTLKVISMIFVSIAVLSFTACNSGLTNSSPQNQEPAQQDVDYKSAYAKAEEKLT
ncbi:hypothetical protein [Clostridium merdae]|uniref:hypothetical protein n=1 Tax=Clostridium merdae TaxID=1958780 RepID=UPI0013563B33|nr:hypothetical protein [Clostridium merdae]